MASSKIQNQYEPDVVSPPGATLAEVLEQIGMSQSDLAERTGRPKKTISEIVNGKAAITPDTALQFEKVLEVSASFWMNRERQYRESLARREEEQRLQGQVGWLDKFPVKEMANLGWIKPSPNKTDILQQILTFFGIASPDQWDDLCNQVQPAFRQSAAYTKNPAAVHAWLRQGERLARQINCAPFNPERFRQTLRHLRTLTAKSPDVFYPELVRRCADCGVAVVFVPELPKTCTFGATRWLTTDKALIQLSLRYKTDDHLWFTFFHEAAHILLHGKRRVFIEAKGEDAAPQQEEAEANQFAGDLLIPTVAYKQWLASRSSISKAGIRTFAAQIGIAPGIIVGRLQHDGRLPPSFCNDLKRRFEFKGI